MRKLHSENPNLKANINISGSKSETNRLLILKAFFPDLEIKNPSDSDDTKVLIKALASKEKTIDIDHAGTAMRFLTAYFAFQNTEKILTGSQRMQNRPIEILVEALQKLGAKIQYQNKEGFPPLHLQKGKIIADKIKIKANISSQYISALILIGATFPKGLTIELEGEILSKPYIEMTLSLLSTIGISNEFTGNKIQIFPAEKLTQKEVVVESDWSSASYFYSLAALSKSAELKLSAFKENSFQGDRKVVDFYKNLGVETYFQENSILLKKKKNFIFPEKFTADLTNFPDLAQTIAVTCLGLKIPFELNGLSTLRIKETDRLQALQTELSKFGATIEIKNNSLIGKDFSLKENIEISTYQDHRMAMAFAPLALKTDLFIKNPEVVSKSFPTFWEVLKKCAIQQTII